MITSIKQQAKALLKNLPGKYALFTLPIILSIVNISVSFRESFSDTSGSESSIAVTFPTLVTFLLAFFTISALYTMLEVVRQQRKSVEFGDLTQSFSGSRFPKLLITLLVRNLLLLPWAILLGLGLGLMIGIPLAAVSNRTNMGGVELVIILVGFILFLLGAVLSIWKSMQYSQTEFIIYDQVAQNRYQGPLAAIKESKQLMKGHIFELFKLYLSFIGWFFLGILTFGLISIYLLPYFTTTRSVYYQYLLEQKDAATTEDGAILTQGSPFDVH
ncbi:DUF975 family protein [Streptococcus halotolerans]|uniref:DUF975 family protein n=1 Tax=Streptococcus halotolerans TaxID=1814128 RepID=UPI000788051C|nr:DUF975 family protein [Streptococcus halotolerans]